MDLAEVEQHATLIWELVYQWGPRILAAFAIFFFGRWIGQRVAHGTEAMLLRGKAEPILTVFLKNLVYYVILVVVALSALSQIGIPTTSFLAILGTAGLAIGLALKDNLSNLAAGVMLLFSRPFKLGDVVQVSGTTGKVQAMTIFETVLFTGDNQKVIIPNGHVMGNTITNMTANPTRRIDLVIGVSYEDDIPKAKQILAKILASQEGVLKDPAPLIAVSELADSSVDFVVRPWVNTGDYWTVRWALIERIKITFDREGICFPFPQQDVHIFTSKD